MNFIKGDDVLKLLNTIMNISEDTDSIESEIIFDIISKSINKIGLDITLNQNALRFLNFNKPDDISNSEYLLIEKDILKNGRFNLNRSSNMSFHSVLGMLEHSKLELLSSLIKIKNESDED